MARCAARGWLDIRAPLPLERHPDGRPAGRDPGIVPGEHCIEMKLLALGAGPGLRRRMVGTFGLHIDRDVPLGIKGQLASHRARER